MAVAVPAAAAPSEKLEIRGQAVDLTVYPARGPARDGALFLPFDDDQRLSVILSKAQLLAHDSAITDPTITGQIRRR